MKRALVAPSVIGGAVLSVVAIAGAQPPTEVPFPAPKADVFVSAHTTTPAGLVTNEFARGSTVVFGAYAADVKTKRVVTAKTAKYFYVKIPDQPNVKLTYRAVGQRLLWMGTWTVPATYRLGVVEFKVLVKTTGNRYGSFVQPAVTNAMLTVVAAAAS